MNGVAVAVHQSSSRIERRKLVSITRSPSVAGDDVRELALGEIAPFAVMAEHIANRHIGAISVIQRGHEIRPDKTGAAGHKQHDIPCPDCAQASFAPVPSDRQLGSSGAVKTAVLDFTSPRGGVTDRIEIHWRLPFKQ
jgi:hypothetical protein